ncbi:ABC transporter ATP-binding protein [Gallaecimonas kandeliae]|uniref:ABC transporter ATP-binding protein n=1 Tax=Gallaecimonas kandeliae TaxID=3029055 RepID=UPI002649C877|nr:ABC transporter ATP-binding protein [Gallaecimonas kandeliae]WKE66855.1 ABC transporter ATP-binding protein [Gallaecimonas kandeliae]
MIELQGVSRRFELGGQQVKGLDRVDLQIAKGDYVSVMGPSGSGKSTLLNVLGLLDRPDEGEYRLAGTATRHLSEEERTRLRASHVGFVFQSFHLVRRLSAADNMALPLVLAGVAPKVRQARIQALLADLQLTDRAAHLPHQLSGGQQQRVAIGRAMAAKPQLLLADEPTGNLDSKAGGQVISLLEDLNRQGITLVLVTHDMEVGKRARRRLRMIDGAIVEDSG